MTERSGGTPEVYRVMKRSGTKERSFPTYCATAITPLILGLDGKREDMKSADRPTIGDRGSRSVPEYLGSLRKTVGNSGRVPNI